MFAFFCHQLHRGSGATGQLRTLTGAQLNAVYGRAQRNVAQGQCIPCLDRRAGSGNDFTAGGQPFGRNNIAALTIGIQYQRNVRATIGIVFQALDMTRNSILVTLEINQAIVLLVAATLMTGGDAPSIVAPAGPVLRFNQRRMGRALIQLGSDHLHDKAATSRCGFQFYDCHH